MTTARKTPGRRRKARKTTTSAAIAVVVVLTSSSSTVYGFAVPPRRRFPASSSSSSLSGTSRRPRRPRTTTMSSSSSDDDYDYDDDARERYLRLAGEAYVRYYSPDAMPGSASASALVDAPSREEYLRLAMDAWERAISSSSSFSSSSRPPSEEEKGKEKEKEKDVEDASTSPPPFFAYSTMSSTTTTDGDDGGVVGGGSGSGGGGDDPTADDKRPRTGVVNDDDVDGGGGVPFLDAAREILSSMTTALFGGGGIGDGVAIVRDGDDPRDAAASAVRDVEEEEEEDEEEEDESVPYGLRSRQRAYPWSSSSLSSTPASSENETNDESINVGVIVGFGVEMKKTTTATTTVAAAAEKRPIEPNILGRMRAKDVVGDDAAIALKESTANTMAETATATGKSVSSEAKSPPRFSTTTRSVSITEGLTAEEAERTRNFRLDAADAFRLGRSLSATDIPRPKNYIPLTEGLTAEEAEVVRNARLDDTGRSRSATDIPLSETSLPLTEGLTAEEAEGVRNARLDDAGRPRSATDIPRPVNYVRPTEGLTAEEAESMRNARLDDADAFIESQKRNASSLTFTMSKAATVATTTDKRPIEPSVIGEGRTMNVFDDSAVSAPIGGTVNVTTVNVTTKTAMATATKRVSGQSKPLSRFSATITEGLTAEEAEGVRNARLADAGRSRSATDISRPKNYIPLTEGLTAEEAEVVRNARLDDTGRLRSATDIPLSETSLPLTEGLTAEEAERVRNARLHDADAFIESQKRTASSPISTTSPISTITTTTAKTVGKAGTRTVASPASVTMVPVPPLVSLTVLAPDNNDTRMTVIDSSENKMNGDVALSSSKSLSQTTSAFVGPEEGGQERLNEEARLITEQLGRERLATLIERERILAAYSTPSSTTTSTKTSGKDGGVVGGSSGGGGDDPTADGKGPRTGVVNDDDVGGGDGVPFLDAAREILSSMTTALFGGVGGGEGAAIVGDGGGPRGAVASAVFDVKEDDDNEEESLPYELQPRASSRPSSTLAENKTDDESIGVRIGVDMGTTMTVTAVEKRPIDPNILGRGWAKDVIEDGVVIALKGDTASTMTRKSIAATSIKSYVDGGGAKGGFPMPLKGKESASPMDTKRGIIGGGGNFLAGLKKSVSVTSDGIGKGVLPFVKKPPPLEAIGTKGVESFGGDGGGGAFMAKSGIGGGFSTPLKGKESASLMDTKSSISGGGIIISGLKKSNSVALKSSSSLKRDGDVFEQADDGSAAPTANEAVGSSIISPLSTPDNLKGAEVFAGDGMKTPNMAGPLKKNSFLASLSKGKGFGETISKDNSNAETLTTTSSLESLSKRNLGALKGKSDNSSTTLMKKSFFESLSKGKLGGMKSKGGPLPLPPPLKGMQISSGTNVGTRLPFMKKSIISNKDGDEAGTASTTPNIVGNAEPGFGEGGPLPFLKKSLFNSSPAEGNGLLDDGKFQSKINSFGGRFPTPLQGVVSMDTKSSGGSFLAGLKNSGGAQNDDNVSMKGIAFDGMKRTGDTLPPPPPLPLKGMQVSRPGVGKELLFKKQSVTTEKGFGIQNGAKSSDEKAMTVPATEVLTIGFQQPLNVRLQGAASIENIRVESVTEGTPDELKYSSKRDVFNDNIDIVSNDNINTESPFGEGEQERLNKEARLTTEQSEQERLAAYIEQEMITAEQKQIVEAARLEQERLAAEADHLRQEIERLKQGNLAEAARLEAERMEHERLSALIEQERSSAKQMQREKEAAWFEEERVAQEEPERSMQAIMMDLTGNEISGYYDGDVTLPSSQTMSMLLGPAEDEGLTSLTTMSLADAKEEPSWRIASSILGDGVMVEDALTFPLLHIGNRIQSNAYGTTHECFLFQSIEAGGGDSNRDNVAAKVFDDGNIRFRITPCIAKRPWSMPELNATVPAQVLALERQQRYYDAIEEDIRQSMPEPWELDDKAAKIRRHYETEIHIFQKFERKREFLSEQRRRIRQQEEAERERGSAKIIGDSSIDGVEAGNLIAVPKFLRVYPDDGSGGPNSDDAISEYGATGADVWGKSLSDPGGSHEWLVYEGRFESVVTLLDAMEMKDVYNNDGVYHHLCGIQRAMNLPETYDFGDVLDVICRSLLEDLVFLSSCNVVHRDLRPGNILCDSENKRLRLANFGNALDLDPPRVGLENDSLELDAPGSIANTLAADVYSVAFIICRLLFDVPDAVLNQQLTGAGFDLDLWFQQTLAAAGSNLMGFSDALTYLSERRGLWGLLKTAIRPNPLRKKITADSLRQFNEVLELKNGNIKLTEERAQKIAREESYLEYVLNLAFGNVGGLPFTIETTAEAGRDSKYEIPSPSYRDEDVFDITRVPYTLQPRTKTSVSVLSKLSKEADQSTPRFKPSDEFATNAPLVSESGDYTDITRLKFTPMRKSLLTDMLVSYANKRPASNFQNQRMEASSRENYYDATAYFGSVSPQRSEQNAFEAVIQSSYITPGGRPSADSMEIVQIFAPAGKLGVEVDTPENGGPAYVSSISDNSPLFGRIFLGDKIVAVDNMDVQSLVADDVSKILLVKSTNTRRLISILRNNFEGVGRPLYQPNGSAGSQVQAALANNKRFEEVEQWLMSYLPQLNTEDAVNYCKCLIDDGFDSLDMLAELLDEDIYFMKKAHKRVMTRKLSNLAAPDEQILPARKVYTVDEALGVAARKGIEATIAEEKRLASEARPVANKAKVGQKNKAEKKPIVVSEAKSKVKEEEWLRRYAAKKAEEERKMKGNE